MTALRKIFPLLFFIGIALPAICQVKFYTQITEAEITVGQTFQVQYIAEGVTEPPLFFLPSFSQFTVHDTFESKSTSVQSPGLNVVEAYSKIVWMSAKKTGTFTIPGATAMINGKKMRSNPVKVIIRSRGLNPAVNAEEPRDEIPVAALSEIYEDDDMGKRIRENLFLKAVANKTTVYAGEAVVLTYKMYSRLNTTSQILKRPSLTGFSIVEMTDAYDGKPEVELVNGVPYYTNLVRKVQGFPLQPGVMDLDIAEVASNIHFVKVEGKQRKTDRNIDALLRSRARLHYFDHALTLVSNRLSINVKELPQANQPANFSGAVGKFSMTVSVHQKEIHPGDLVKIQVLVRGTGNIPLVVAPEIAWPKGVDTAEPAVKEEFNKFVYPLYGFKTFEYSFTAPDSGSYVIPATDFVYFNPATQHYETSRSDSITLTVTPGAPKNEEADKALRSEVKKESRPLHLYWFGVVVAVILGWVGYQASRGKKSAAVKEVRNKEVAIPEDPLKNAKASLAGGEILSFYDELGRALWKAAADYCEVLPSSLNKRNVASVLMSKGIDTGTIEELTTLLNECEWALYAPEHEVANAEAALEKAETVVKKMEMSV